MFKSKKEGGGGFLSSLADKAQHLGERIQGAASSKETKAAEGAPSAVPGNDAASPTSGAPNVEQSGTFSGRPPVLEVLQHQFRSLQVHYSSGVSQENHQLQLLVTSQKSVSLDFDAVGRDAKAHSKELYLWGQTQEEDLKDVTDRLAYINYIHGALSYTLATEINKSRQAWKNVRDAEAQLAPRRTALANLKKELQKFQTDGGRTGNVDQKIAELQAQITKHEADDSGLEREVELLKRSAVKESEIYKWKALKEYGQKLTLLATANEQILQVLPSSPGSPYTGAQHTAAVRSSLQRALDTHEVGKPDYLPVNTGNVSVDDTRSFGETHAHELSTIASVTHPGPPTPGHTHAQLPEDTHGGIEPNSLNNNPSAIPPVAASPAVGTTHLPPAGAPPSAYHPPPSTHYAPPTGAPPGKATPPTVPVPTTTLETPASSSSVPISGAPTVAETGVPLSAADPGPVHGNLNAPNKEGGEKDLALDRPVIGYGVGSPNSTEPTEGIPPVYVQPASATSPEGGHGQSHQGSLVASGSVRRPETHHESAEEEKKRLEREEREKILREQNPSATAPSKDPDAPPAYV